MNKRSFPLEQEFGLVVGGVLMLLATWWFYRHKHTGIAQVAVTIGITLAVLGVAAPRVLVYPRRAWMFLAEALSYVMTRAVLAIVFFGIITPIGWFKRILGWDPLRRRAGSSSSYWRPYSERQHDPRHYEKMF